MMDNIDHVSRAYADLEKQDKRIKQLEAENDKLKQVIKFEISQPFIRSEQEERLQKALKGE